MPLLNKKISFYVSYVFCPAKPLARDTRWIRQIRQMNINRRHQLQHGTQHPELTRRIRRMNIIQYHQLQHGTPRNRSWGPG